VRGVVAGGREVELWWVSWWVGGEGGAERCRIRRVNWWIWRFVRGYERFGGLRRYGHSGRVFHVQIGRFGGTLLLLEAVWWILGTRWGWCWGFAVP